MANENTSREGASRQQSSERPQSGAMSQQGAGTRGAQSDVYGQGGQESQGRQGSYGQGSQGGAYGQGASGPGRSGQGGYSSQGMSTWQGGQADPSSGALQRRGSSSMSPYGGQESYGGGPFSLMRRISDEMDRFFENFGFGRSSFFPSETDMGGGRNVPSMWSPHIEVSERGGKLVISADLPGIKRDDINVRIEQDAVIIQGERMQQQTTDQRGYYRSERSYGSFYRTIPLPEGTNPDTATASFRDGVLEIELDAPREQQRGRTLEIRDTSQGSAQGGHAGTGSGSTYGSGTTGSLQGSTSGGTTGASQHAAGGTSSEQGSGSSQQSGSGTYGSQHQSGSGTMYSGSGNPSTGAAAMGATPGGSSDRADDR